MKELTTQETQAAIMLCGSAEVPLFMHSSPGAGKSSLVKQLHGFILEHDPHYGLVDLRLSQIEGIDMRGLMHIEKGKTRYIPPTYLPVDPDWQGIMFFDEYPLGDDDTRKAAIQILSDHRIGEHDFSENIMYIAAGNNMEDETLNRNLSSPEANRFCHIQVRNDLEEGLRISKDGFYSDGKHIPDWSSLPEILRQDSGLSFDGRIEVFLTSQHTEDNKLIDSFDRALFRKGEYAHPTWRTWHAVSRVLAVLERDEDIWNAVPNIVKIRRAVICGLIGDGAGSTFTGTMEMLHQLVDIEAVKKNGRKAPLIDKDDPMSLSVSWMSIGVLTDKRHFNPETVDNILTYIKRLGDHINNDLTKMAVAQIEKQDAPEIHDALEVSKVYHKMQTAEFLGHKVA